MTFKYGIIFLILACFTGMFGVSPAQGDRCPPEWKSYGDSCYFRQAASSRRKSWQDAQKECENMQANLVTVNSDHEMKFLMDLLGDWGGWCGLNNLDNLQQFEWVSGENSGYTNWGRNQPQVNKKKQCVRIQRTQNYKWITNKCNNKLRYTCEKAAAAPVKPCASGPCQNGGTCIEEGEGYRCQCPQQFTGNNCETEIVPDPCEPNPCMNGGTCTSSGDVISCSCTAKFTGARCKTPVNPCDSEPCLNGGTCHSFGQDQYECYCDYRYGGDHCETLLCSAYPCENGGTCIEVGNKALCRCPAAFVGTFCEGVIPFIKQNPEDAVRMEGDKITLCCKAEGKPTPEFEWFKDNLPLNKEETYESTLKLTGLSSADAGSYQCRARNKFGAAFSETAELKIVPGTGEDSCTPTPLIKEEVLPPGCKEDSSGSDKVNVGTCSNEACVKRNQGGAGGCGGQTTPMCCSGTSVVDSHVTCGNGIGFNVQKIQRCSCAPCIQRAIFIHGRVVDTDRKAVRKAEIRLEGVKKLFIADSEGYFTVGVMPGTRRVVLTVKDSRFMPGRHIETSKAFTLHEGQTSFYTIVLQKSPPERKFKATEEQNIPLGTEGSRPSFVALRIPPEAFINKDGSIYRGEVTSKIGVIDPRNGSDMASAPGDFSAVDENGEEIMLGTAGILRQTYSDANGKRLSLSKNITVQLDSDQLQIPDGVTVYQWYLSKQTGRWVKFGQLREESVSRRKRQARKFWVADITPDIPSDSINWDYVATVSYVRVLAPAGAVVTRIGRDGGQYTSYRQETVPGNGLLCMRAIRDKAAILQADLSGEPLFPVTPVGFPTAVNPSVIDGSAAGNPFGIRSILFTSTKVNDIGPVYLKGEDGRCSQNLAGDLAFQFQRAVGTGLSFRWTSPRTASWYPNPNNICFVKVVIGGSKPESVLYLKSTGKGGGANVDYGYTAEKATRVGNAGVVCLEYRCGEGTTATVQTHLQLLSLTGNCGNIRVNSVLAGAQCFVQPDPDSQREENFCIPNDLSGGNAGLYTGDPGLALFRCEAGNNQFSQGPPTLTANAPTVQLDCN